MAKRKTPSLSSLKKKAWKLCSEFVRRSDADEGGTTQCFTCGAYLHWKYDAQAGHAIPGRHNAVLLDTEILRPQCYSCNCMKKGQHHIFATKLIQENGMAWWESKLQNSRSVVKWTRADLEELIESFKKKLERLNERDRNPRNPRDSRTEESREKEKAEGSMATLECEP